jgi:hypothetical protein
MKTGLIISTLLFAITLISQESVVYKFDGYLNESESKIEAFVSFEIDSTNIQISYFSSVNEDMKLLTWNSYTIDSSASLANDSIKTIYCHPFQFNFIKIAAGIVVIEQCYYNRVLRSFHDETEFEVDYSKSEFSVSDNPILIIQNPQFDYLVKGNSNTVMFTQNGVPISNLIVVSDNCNIESKYGSASISDFTDSIAIIKLVDKLDSTVYLTKTFIVTSSNETITLEDDYINIEFCGGEIATESSRKLLLNKVNTLYLANWENIKSDIKIELENAKKISYKNGLLKLLPNGEGIVRVTIYETEKGDMLVSSQFTIK